MKLDRNINDDRMGKYAILNLRKLADFRDGTFQNLAPKIIDALITLEENGILDWGRVGTGSEFFLIKLKDCYANIALAAYAGAASNDDPEYAKEILEMAARSGPFHPLCKRPD